MSKHLSGLLGVANETYAEVPLTLMRWLRELLGALVVGAVYLGAGPPGIGKSRLSLQLALDLGLSGLRTLYILTEEPKSRLRHRALQMCSGWSQARGEQAMAHVLPEDGIYDLETLPQFLAHQVLSPTGLYHGVRLIVLDSVQGHGLHAAATRKYHQLYEFCRQCQSAGITILLLAHVTKRGEIAGPKDLEHNVDCVLVMRKAMAYRPLFIPKNRFGPAILKPVPLIMDPQTTLLSVSPHRQSISSVTQTYLGQPQGITEIQAAVSLPTYGSHGRITAPGLPRKEIEQLTSCISQLDDIELSDMDYTIHCRVPGERRYRGLLGLPLCIALIGSYIQRAVPTGHLYLGEIDLLCQVRPVPDALIQDLAASIGNGEVATPVNIFCASQSASLLQQIPGVTVTACDRLDQAVYRSWPDLQPERTLLI